MASAPAWRLSAAARCSPRVAPRAASRCRPKPVSLSTLETLTQRRDFLAANRGRRVATPGFVLLVRPRADADPKMRVGFTVTKKIGNAVVRNRCKRRLRALAREVLSTAGVTGADHVLIGRDETATRDFATMRADLSAALARVGK